MLLGKITFLQRNYMILKYKLIFKYNRSVFQAPIIRNGRVKLKIHEESNHQIQNLKINLLL